MSIRIQIFDFISKIDDCSENANLLSLKIEQVYLFNKNLINVLVTISYSVTIIIDLIKHSTKTTMK